MTRQQAPSGAVARAARGLTVLVAGLTCMTLVTPVAAASPIGNADNAITAAWKDAGGDNSELGAKQGDCYVAGQGFAQDFAHGKIFFTPATGPRSMMGAVLQKYEALGGPAASSLGFPTANEVRGLAGPDSRVSTFSAGDKPLIYWTANHGAFVVRGAINAAWDKLGSSGGSLGVPTGDATFDGEVATQAFSGGKVSWNRVTKAFNTVPPDLAAKLTDLQIPTDPTSDINMAWLAAGGPSGPLGAKQGDPYPAANGGLAQNFAGGKIFFSPASGANAIETDILTKYESLGGPGGDLGFPVANEADGGLKTASKVSTFSAVDKPAIFWTADHGAFVIRGAIKAAWDKLLGATGKLGAPLHDQTVNKDVVTQKFTGGQIAWNKRKNTFSTQPANLASALSGLAVPGQKTPAGSAPSGGEVSWLSAHWWLLASIGAVLLLGLVALSARWRRRRDGAGRAGRTDAGRLNESSYESANESVSRWLPDADADLASASLSKGHQPQRRTVRLSSQPSSEWMPPGRTSLTDELLEDDNGNPDEFPGLADFDRDVHEDFGRDLHEDFDEDTDDVDTDPTGIPLLDDGRGGRHAASYAHDDDGQATEVVPIPSIAPGQLAIHLPMDDPYQVPDGYQVKAHASSGLYYMPDNALYDETMAEIWFASEEIAQANGFHKAG